MNSIQSMFSRIAERELQTLEVYNNRLDKLDLSNVRDVSILKDLRDTFKNFRSQAPGVVLPAMNLLNVKFAFTIAECKKNHTEIYQKVFQPAARALEQQTRNQ